MTDKAQTTVKPDAQPSLNVNRSRLLQRKCACGNSAGLAGDCSQCQNKPFTRQGIGGERDASAPLLHDLVQTKLTVGAVGDKYEQEADRLATQVVDQIHSPLPESTGTEQAALRIGEEEEGDLSRKSLQRRSEKDELQMSLLAKSIQRLGEEEDELKMSPQVQRVGIAGGKVSGDFESQLNRARGGGQSLVPDLQAQMERVMGADFSGVRVHTDERADGLNRAVGAQAFTRGQDVFFKRGEYQPGNRRGQELIAHELTHVVQQESLVRIQRKYIDNPDAFINLSSNPSEYMLAVYASLENVGDAVQAVDDSAQDMQWVSVLEPLLQVQLQMEIWREMNSEEYLAPEFLSENQQLVREIKKSIQSVETLVMKNYKLKTGIELAMMRQSSLISLAMRITVENAAHVNSTEHARTRQSNRVAEHRDLEKSLRPVAPTLIETPKSLMDKGAALEENERGVCSEFAAAAASMLIGDHSVRIEIMGTHGGGGHNFVVLGRQDCDLHDYDEWGDGAIVIDCWWGAMRWDGYEEYPDVIYTPAEHRSMENNPDVVYYDTLKKARNPLLAALKGLKKVK